MTHRTRQTLKWLNLAGLVILAGLFAWSAARGRPDYAVLILIALQSLAWAVTWYAPKA